MHHGTGRLVSRSSTVHSACTRTNRAQRGGLALAAEEPHPAPAASPWRFSSLEHFVRSGARLPAAGPFARRIWRSGRRRDMPDRELSFLLAPAQRAPGRDFRNFIPPILDAISGKIGRSGYALRGRALLRVSRSGDGEPGLVSAPER